MTDDARDAERSQRAAEERLSDFQLGLQRRLESGLRINTLILAGAAVISVAFAFNAMVLLERAFDAEAMDTLITDIREQTARLARQTDDVVVAVETLRRQANEQASVLTSLSGNDGDLAAIKADARRLARALRKSRGGQEETDAALRDARAQVATLAESLVTSIDELSNARDQDLTTVRTRAAELAAQLDDELTRLTGSSLGDVEQSGTDLAAELRTELDGLRTWQASADSLTALGTRATELRRRLDQEETKLTEIERLSTSTLERLGALTDEIERLRAALETERRALAPPSPTGAGGAVGGP